MRFIFNRWMALRFELRDGIYREKTVGATESSGAPVPAPQSALLRHRAVVLLPGQLHRGIVDAPLSRPRRGPALLHRRRGAVPGARPADAAPEEEEAGDADQQAPRVHAGSHHAGAHQPQQPGTRPLRSGGRSRAARRTGFAAAAADAAASALQEGDRTHHHLRGARRHRPHRGPAAAGCRQRGLQPRGVRQGGAGGLGADERPEDGAAPGRVAVPAGEDALPDGPVPRRPRGVQPDPRPRPGDPLLLASRWSGCSSSATRR